MCLPPQRCGPVSLPAMHVSAMRGDGFERISLCPGWEHSPLVHAVSNLRVCVRPTLAPATTQAAMSASTAETMAPCARFFAPEASKWLLPASRTICCADTYASIESVTERDVVPMHKDDWWRTQCPERASLCPGCERIPRCNLLLHLYDFTEASTQAELATRHRRERPPCARRRAHPVQSPNAPTHPLTSARFPASRKQTSRLLRDRDASGPSLHPLQRGRQVAIPTHRSPRVGLKPPATRVRIVFIAMAKPSGGA
ncbi:hypothetical protein C8R44DRAFT_193493 [Mycena epipterygia]|nr:hypothetical protein C8R44DRAFT_193493 [Mycena epipterygia]